VCAADSVSSGTFPSGAVVAGCVVNQAESDSLVNATSCWGGAYVTGITQQFCPAGTTKHGRIQNFSSAETITEINGSILCIKN